MDAKGLSNISSGKPKFTASDAHIRFHFFTLAPASKPVVATKSSDAESMTWVISPFCISKWDVAIGFTSSCLPSNIALAIANGA